MKKIIPLILVLIFIQTAAAQVDVLLPKKSIVVYSGQSASTTLWIVNNGTAEEGFTVSVFPPQSRGVVSSVYPQILFVPANSNKSVEIYFSALEGAEPVSTIFTLTVQSISKPDVKYIKDISVLVLRKSPVYISDLTINKYTFDPSETVNIDVVLTNVADQISPSYKLVAEIIYGNQTIQEMTKVTDNVPATSSLKVSLSYKLDKYAPNGTYVAKVTLFDLNGNRIDSKTKEFVVRAVYKLPKDYTKKETSWALLATKTIITVKNDGNVPTPEFYIEERMPIFMKDFFQPDVKPTLVEVSNGMIVYKWLVPSLSPGQSIVITYRISLWGVWLALIAIGFAVYLFFIVSFKPVVVKRHGSYSKEEKEIPIIIEVRNKSRKPMKGVTVVDYLPKSSKISIRFGNLKPEVKKAKGIEELVWRLDSLGGGEERAIVYYIKPLAKIEEIELPSTKVFFYDEKGNKKVLNSNELVVKFLE